MKTIWRKSEDCPKGLILKGRKEVEITFLFYPDSSHHHITQRQLSTRHFTLSCHLSISFNIYAVILYWFVFFIPHKNCNVYSYTCFHVHRVESCSREHVQKRILFAEILWKNLVSLYCVQECIKALHSLCPSPYTPPVWTPPEDVVSQL